MAVSRLWQRRRQRRQLRNVPGWTAERRHLDLLGRRRGCSDARMVLIETFLGEQSNFVVLPPLQQWTSLRTDACKTKSQVSSSQSSLNKYHAFKVCCAIKVNTPSLAADFINREDTLLKWEWFTKLGRWLHQPRWQTIQKHAFRVCYHTFQAFKARICLLGREGKPFFEWTGTAIANEIHDYGSLRAKQARKSTNFGMAGVHSYRSGWREYGVKGTGRSATFTPLFTPLPLPSPSIRNDRR